MAASRVTILSASLPGTFRKLSLFSCWRDRRITDAAAAGLELEKAFAYRIRRHYMKFPRSGRGGIILLDWVLVLRARDAPMLPPSRLPLPHARVDPFDVAN